MAIDTTDLQNQLKKILTDELFIEVPIEEINEDDSIGTSLGLDSIGFVELGTIIRERFNISVEESDLTSGAFATIKSVCEFIAGTTTASTESA